MNGADLAGLDYGAARCGIEAAGFTITPELWTKIILIEAGALEAKNKDT